MRKLLSATKKLASRVPTWTQFAGAGCLVAAAWLSWGVEPGLAALGVVLLVFGLAAEL